MLDFGLSSIVNVLHMSFVWLSQHFYRYPMLLLMPPCSHDRRNGRTLVLHQCYYRRDDALVTIESRGSFLLKVTIPPTSSLLNILAFSLLWRDGEGRAGSRAPVSDVSPLMTGASGQDRPSRGQYLVVIMYMCRIFNYFPVKMSISKQNSWIRSLEACEKWWVSDFFLKFKL